MINSYLKSVMIRLSNILHNTSQSNSLCNSKEVILDSIENLLIEYNGLAKSENQVSIVRYDKKQ